MISRHARVQDKRATRKGITLLVLSAILLIGMLFFGMPILSKFAGIVLDLKGSNQATIVEDKTPPAPPQFSPSPPITAKEASITVTVRAEAGSTLKIFHNDTQLVETIVDNTSKFERKITLFTGANFLWAVASDQAGNESTKSSIWEIVYDKTAPLIEITSPKDGEEFFGDKKSVPVDGATEEGVKITVNDRLAIVSPEGKFSQKVNLQEGENIILVVATDKGENTTEREIRVKYSP